MHPVPDAGFAGRSAQPGPSGRRMNRRCDIVIAGVGGQGILLASNILGEACVRQGLPVKSLETHGMAQRGGSVEAHVRIGCIYGPKVPVGKADLLIGLEPLEAARFAPWLRSGGIAVVHTGTVPLPGAASYPSQDRLQSITSERAGLSIMHDFSSLTDRAGSVRTLNVVMIGACARFLPLSTDVLREAMLALVSPAFHAMNIAAFEAGVEFSARWCHPLR